METQDTDKKELRRKSPSEAAASLLEDILSHEDKKTAVIDAVEKLIQKFRNPDGTYIDTLATRSEVASETLFAAYDIRYTTPELMSTRIYEPLGMVPFEEGKEYDEFGSMYVGELKMLHALGMLVTQAIDEGYEPAKIEYRNEYEETSLSGEMPAAGESTGTTAQNTDSTSTRVISTEVPLIKGVTPRPGA